MGRGPGVLQLEEQLLGKAPEPALAGLEGADQGMGGVTEVGRGVPPRRVVTAPDVAAALAHPQVHPVAAGLQALLAAGAARRDLADLIEVGADSHDRSYILYSP